MTNQPDQECPQCHARSAVLIAYGLPGPEMFKAAEDGKLALGGCVIADDSPAWRCKACGARWGHLRQSR